MASKTMMRIQAFTLSEVRKPKENFGRGVTRFDLL